VVTVSVIGTGMEAIQAAAIQMLVTNLPAALAAEQASWVTADATMESVLGHGIPLPVALETIPSQNIYPGHVPSLIEAPLHKYPNLCVLVDQLSGDTDTLDNFWVPTAALAVEIMVKSGFYDTDDATGVGEEICNRRILRTVNAVATVFEQNRTLGGVVEPFSDPQRISVSDVFVRREEKSRGPRWFWQGARIDYNVPKIQRAY